MWWKKRLWNSVLLFSISLVLLAVSCTPSPEKTKEVVLPAQAGPATNTLTPSPVPATMTRVPTLSATPAGTITATLSPTQTLIPPSSTETLDLSGTRTVEQIIARGKPAVIQSSRSPDMKWRAEVIRYDCVQVGNGGENAYEVLRLVQVADGRETVLGARLLYCGGLGAFGLGIVFWSPDSHILYYTHSREGVPDGCTGGWWRSLIAAYIVNGEQKELRKGALSPDRKTLAYPMEPDLVLWDLNKGEIGRVAALHPDWHIGAIAWSPQGDTLVYLQNEDWCFEGKAAVVRIDLPELKATVLVETLSPGFQSVEWETPNRIRLVDNRGFEWTLDLAPK